MERTKAISTRYYLIYKAVSITILGGVILAYLWSYVDVVFRWPWYVGFPFFCLLLYSFFRLFREKIKDWQHLKDISYDSENLDITEKGREEQIPFHEIKDVEITSLNGVYRFIFYNKELHGGWVSCKTSMWYPLNFPKVDKELNRVRSLINRAHHAYQEEPDASNQLMSFN